jgi:hypothetical protein
MELRKFRYVGALVVPIAGATLYMTEMAKGRAVRPESKNMAQKQSGSPRNLGDPAVSTGSIGFWGVAEPEAPPAHRHCVLGGGSETKTHRVVPPSEGNEVRREGRQEVVAP